MPMPSPTRGTIFLRSRIQLRAALEGRRGKLDRATRQIAVATENLLSLYDARDPQRAHLGTRYGVAVAAA